MSYHLLGQLVVITAGVVVAGAVAIGGVLALIVCFADEADKDPQGVKIAQLRTDIWRAAQKVGH